MAKKRILLPNFFSGTADENPAEFWRRLSNNMQYKNIDGPNKLRLAKAMLVESACDWLKKLPDPTKADYALLTETFKKIATLSHQFCALGVRAKCLKKQGIDETVDAYASRLQGLANKVNVNDDTLLYVFVSGLRPKLASYVLGKNFPNVTSAIDDARIAEMSNSAASDTSHLAHQMSKMRKDIQKMAKRDDTMTLSASVQRERSKSPAHTLTFREPKMTQKTHKNYFYASHEQGGGNYRGSQFHGRG